MSKFKRGPKILKPVNYTLDTQKITFSFLKTHLWSAADILRGSLDAGEYRQPVMTLLFLKRLNDTFEENVDKLVKKGIKEKDAWTNKNRHNFFVPDKARWSVLTKTSENIGEKIDKVCSDIERDNPDLDGVLTNTNYNDKRKYPDDKLRQLISHFNSPRLRNEDLESPDIFGDAYEYLLEQFADESKKGAGQFFTPREVVRLLVNLVEPKEGMKICDPTCGSGGMLIESRRYVEKSGGNERNLVIEGQDSNYSTVGMCKMNMVLHNIVDFKIEFGDILTSPRLVDGGRLKKYDRVIANFPFSMNWDNKTAAKDPYNRFKFGEETIVASVHRSRRVRTSEVIIDEDGVVIRTPMNKPMSEIESIVRRKKDWISRKQKEYRKREYQITKPTFEADSTLPYLGKNIPIKIRGNSGNKDNMEFINGEFQLSISGKATPMKVHRVYEGWIHNRAYNIFSLKVGQHCKFLNIETKKISIKDMKGRWGAITKQGEINLNVNLVKAPEDVIDYMIIHELCHFIIKGHSHHFWELIRSYFPRYKEAIQWLELNSKAMI